MRTGLCCHHDPSLGVDVEESLAGGTGNRALLIDIDGISQQGQHQALLGGHSMAARNIEILGGQDLMETDDLLHDHIGGGTEFSHCSPSRPPQYPGRMNVMVL